MRRDRLDDRGAQPCIDAARQPVQRGRAMDVVQSLVMPAIAELGAARRGGGRVPHFSADAGYPSDLARCAVDDLRLLKTGIAGSVIAAVCCATPVLVVLLGALGLSAWAGWLDYVLLPSLVVFLGITVYALHRRRARAHGCATAVRQHDAGKASDE